MRIKCPFCPFPWQQMMQISTLTYAPGMKCFTESLMLIAEVSVSGSKPHSGSGVMYCLHSPVDEQTIDLY